MPRPLSLGLLIAALAPVGAGAEQQFPARLAGHAFVPAMTMMAPPADAPRDAWISGKFTTATRVDRPMTVPGDTGAAHGGRSTGISVPFLGQPWQGLSGFAMAPGADGTIVALIDNGFGSKANSPDALLSFTRIRPDWQTGGVEIVENVFLRDPGHVVPFRIAYEGTDSRYLTGADFDPESVQLVGDEVWIGEEFGPFLIRATLDGVVTGVFPTRAEGQELRSPDHPALRVPAAAGTDWTVPRSAGFEGMAFQPGTGLLWAMLERPLLGADGSPEGQFLRVLAFDPAAGDWTGAQFRLRLDPAATAIGDFNFIDATRALVIERDNGEGDPSLRCEGDPRPDCFPAPAMLKRVVLIDTADLDAAGFARRIGYIDLMDIADPDGLAKLDTDAARDLTGRFTFPFFTIESVKRVDDTHIAVAMDNNLPFSSGRRLDRAADNEMILLAVPELLGAR
jgi:hypothetical protein